MEKLNSDIYKIAIADDHEPLNKTIVRLSRSYWHDKNGAYQKLSIVKQKRLSQGYDILEDDCANIGFEEVFPRILNLDEWEDGYYQIATCNEHRDYETGYIDDYDYRLVPYVKEEKTT